MRRPTLRRRPDHASTLTDDGDIKAAYAEHGPELYRFALRQLGDVGAAQDVVQEVFLRAWRSASGFDPDVASLRVWLFAIARNAVIDAARRDRVRPWQRPVAVVPDVQDGPHTPIDDLLNSWVVEEALRRISPDHRAVIVQIHLRGRPADEVAAELGVPIGTVRSRLFYGLKALKLAMEEMGVEP